MGESFVRNSRVEGYWVESLKTEPEFK